MASDTFYDVCMYVCMHVCMRTHSAQGVGVYDVCMYVYVHISCTFVKYLWCSESGGCATDRGVSHRIVRVTCLYIYIYIYIYTHTHKQTLFFVGACILKGHLKEAGTLTLRLYIYALTYAYIYTYMEISYRSMHIERASKRDNHATRKMVHTYIHAYIHRYIHGNIIQEHAY